MPEVKTQILPTRRTPATLAAVGDLAPRPVTALEPFFHLVFVFTITQLAELLVHDLHPRGIVQLLLVYGRILPLGCRHTV